MVAVKEVNKMVTRKGLRDFLLYIVFERKLTAKEVILPKPPGTFERYYWALLLEHGRETADYIWNVTMD